MRSFKDILKAKERGDVDSVEKEVEGLPPGYIVGFALEINSDENSIRLGPGVANVRNRLVKLTDVTPLTQDTAAGGDFLSDTRYYIYVGIDGRITVDRLAPVFDGQLFGRYHPVGGMRFIGRFYVSETGAIQEIISENPLNASSISAEQLVSGSLDEIISGVVEGLFDLDELLEIIDDKAAIEYVDQQAQQLLSQFSIITNNLFAGDIVIGGQIRSLNYTPEGNVINPENAGFWLSSTGKLKVRNADLIGTLQTGEGASSQARVAIRDGSGIVSGPTFDGSGLNDLVVLSDGSVSGTWEVEIVSQGVLEEIAIEIPTQVEDPWTINQYGPSGDDIVFYDKGFVSNGWRYLSTWKTGIGPGGGTALTGWAATANLPGGPHTAVGMGYENTYTHMNSPQYPAAWLMIQQTLGGFTDWYLPSRDEMDWLLFAMYGDPALSGTRPGPDGLIPLQGQANGACTSLPCIYLEANSQPNFPANPGQQHWSSSSFDVNTAWRRAWRSSVTGTFPQWTKVTKTLSNAVARPVRRFVTYSTVMVPSTTIITNPTKFRWRKDGGAWSEDIEIPESLQYAIPQSEIVVGFNGRLHHSVGDRWTFEQGSMKALSVRNGVGQEYVSFGANNIDIVGDVTVTGSLTHNGIITVAVPGPQGTPGATGPQGPPGPKFTIDAVGPLSDRSLYDGEEQNFVYYATDTELFYIRQPGSGWTEGFPFSMVISGQLEIQTLKLRTYSEKSVQQTWSSATQVIDLNIASVYDVTISANVTNLSFVNAIPNEAMSFTLIVTQGSTARTITWPASVKWADDNIQPTINIPNRTFVLSFMTANGGNIWYGFLAGGDFI